MSTGVLVSYAHPIPPPYRKGYPWRTIAVGGSFLMLNTDTATASAHACGAGKRHGVTFRCRREGDHVRVWRVA